MNRDLQTVAVTYDDEITRAFLWASMIFGIVAMLVGVVIATQLSFWQANLETSWLSFGRLRPLHTNAAIFAFVGNMMFAGIYYSTQRLLKTRMASDALSWINFWGWQLIIVSAAISLPLGLTQGKEYAELIWPIDVAITVIWVVFAVNFFWTLAKRNEPNLYVALWFYIATIVTIAVLHIVNSLALPTGPFHSYPVYSGVQDALVQWWYGHNAVGFFLTTPILGIMYYFMPKAAGRPVYSYRLSIVHFWALIFLYIWAGPHHLLNTSLPDWAQSLGMVFSLVLWAPSWGGMLNGLLTLRGAWDKLRTDPVIKFFVAAITFYGMATFEGPLLSIKAVNSLAHYTDWIIAHVHMGALGWNGFMAAGMIYWLVPRLWSTRLWSTRLADAHFWIGTFGLLLYVASMWTSGVNQGLFWGALGQDGFLKYPDFVEGLLSAQYLFHMRLTGGTLYLIGYLLLLINVIQTVRAGEKSTVTVEVVPRERPVGRGTRRLLWSPPIIMSLVLLGLVWAFLQGGMLVALFALGGMIALGGILWALSGGGKAEQGFHRLLEGNSTAFTILVLFAILAGGIAELIPSIVLRRDVPVVAEGADDSRWQKPYSPLELAGRDVYIAEGCYNCHSQMIRPFRHETLRYGDYSRLEESILDRPFQFGSKRTGPDLQRVGGKYPNLWHYQHMLDPRSTSPGSNMPAYSWLKGQQVDLKALGKRIQVMQRLGVPYANHDIVNAATTARSQGELIAADLAESGVTLEPTSELAAIIAYLQRLGRGPQPVGASTPVSGEEE